MPVGSSDCWRELGFELWIGDPAQIKAKRVRSRRQIAWMPRYYYSGVTSNSAVEPTVLVYSP